EATAATFWKETLQGFTTPTPLPPCSPTPPLPHSPTPPLLTLSAKKTAEIQNFLRSHRLTLNTLMQGVWAMLLHRYSGKSDVLFGSTISGRQADLAGVEAIVGLLISVLPVRVAISPDQAIVTWLQTLQTQQAEASRYAYASPDQIQSWSQGSGRLFDSLLVIENYPVRVAEADCSLQVDNVQSGLVSTYRLTVIVKPGDTLTLMLRADSERFSNAQLETLLDQFQEILNAIAEDPNRTIREILPSLGEAIVSQPQPSPSVSESLPNLSREQLEGSFFAPSNPLELKLTQIWEGVLGVRPLSVEDSFFDVGGDSLLAVQLFNQMQQQLDCTLPLATLFQAPNVRKFAALLNQEQPVSTWTSLVPIQPSGSQLPLFFHGGSADALTWARFSHLLGPDQPFYALQRPDLDGSEVIHNSVEALATACVEEMRMVQPNGPYLVGGHCFGGAVAFEIAQQLQAQGEEIVSIVLIDAYRPEPPPDTTLIRLQGKLQLGVFWLRKNYYYHGGWEKLALLPSKIWQRLKPAPPSAPASTELRERTSQASENKGTTADNQSAVTAPTAPTPPRFPMNIATLAPKKRTNWRRKTMCPNPTPVGSNSSAPISKSWTGTSAQSSAGKLSPKTK
ncbi:MAG: alpha/beta fold hydrolase, partial [Cyanobacteria bacterium J06659_2]